VNAPDPNRNTLGSLEVSRRNNGRFRVFVGNAYGTCGTAQELDPTDVPQWLADNAPRVLAADQMERNPA
jgi:hypothetical protein